MAEVKNKTKGLRYIGDVTIVPGQSAEVPDELLESDVVKCWIEQGDIEVASPGKSKRKAD